MGMLGIAGVHGQDVLGRGDGGGELRGPEDVVETDLQCVPHICVYYGQFLTSNAVTGPPGCRTVCGESNGRVDRVRVYLNSLWQV